MKRIFLALFIFACSGGVASAQQSQQTTMIVMQQSQQFKNYYSMRAGVNFSTLMGTHEASKAQCGFNAAMLYNIAIMQSMPLYLQTGIGIEMKGAHNSTVLTGMERSRFKSYAVELPLVATFDVPVGRYSAVVPEFGFYYSFAFCGSLDSDGDFIRPYDKQEIWLDNETVVDDRIMRRSDFGIRAGVAYRYREFTLGFAYDAGMLNIFTKDLRDEGYDTNTGSWSLNLGYRFNR